METQSKKTRVALLSICSNIILIILKVIAGIMSGSVSIISEAIHSSMDLAAAIIAFFSVRLSSKPADKSHPYGHGKIENISGVIEGLLIFVAAFLIIKGAVSKIIYTEEVAETSIGIVVMIIASLANIFVSRTLYKVAKAEDSVALEADALHLMTDVYTSAGVAVGLILIKLTGISILDPIVAILVALLIIKEAWSLCHHAFSPLLDASLSDEEQQQIKDLLQKYYGQIKDYHKLRTRKSGNLRYIDFHMLVDGDLTVRESHKLTQIIEEELEKIMHNTSVNIHIEPSN